jgi:hypothetical protein
MSALLLILRVGCAVSVLAVFALLGLWAGPDAEAALAPVVERQRVDGVHRSEDGREVCWTHHFDKTRAAEPYDANWTVRGAGRIFPFQRVWRVDAEDRLLTEIAPRPVADGLTSRRCAEIPGTLIGRPLTITGFMEYRTPQTGRLWSVRQATPEVEVP